MRDDPYPLRSRREAGPRLWTRELVINDDLIHAAYFLAALRIEVGVLTVGAFLKEVVFWVWGWEVGGGYGGWVGGWRVWI